MKISEKQRKEIYNSTDKMIEKIEKSMNEIEFCCSRKDFWKMTNADRIREMSNEELAYILSDIKGDYGQYIPVFPNDDDHKEWMEWLRQEVDE